MLPIGDDAAGAPFDLRIEVLARPIGPGRLQGGILVPLACCCFQLDQGLLGGDHRLAAAVTYRGNHQIHHRAAGFVQIEARPKDRSLPGPTFRPCLRLVEQGAVAGVVGVMQIARRLHPFRGDHAQRLHAEGRAFAFTCPQLCLVRFVCGEIVPVALGCLGPCQRGTGFSPFPQSCLAGLVSAFSVEGGTAQLGDAGDLVDADGGLEHQR